MAHTSFKVRILASSWRCPQAYFSTVLEEQRELWDASADIKAFFFPGPPTSYSAALSRRRSEQLKEVRQTVRQQRRTSTPTRSMLSMHVLPRRKEGVECSPRRRPCVG